jgi:flavin reductase (DIM6/NTAB) family NADH-FMN oxidoreductase RutF
MTASVLHRFPVGDHCIVVAAIRDCEEPGADPLLYHDRAYHGLGGLLRPQ